MFRWLQSQLPKIVLAPSFAAVIVFVYGFIGWTAYVSFTRSKLLPRYQFEGLLQYRKLWQMDRWYVALDNLLVFSVLFILFCMVLGLLLAVLLDQRIRVEGALRTIYLYPMALSFIVTGTAWKWLLNPGLGVQKVVRGFGFENFEFDWLVDPEMAIYTIVIAGVWQSSGFVMAMFLAGLRSIDDEIIKAAYIDGASLPRIYFGIIIPSMRPVFLSAFIVLAHLAIKSFDLIIVLTRGGPGYATDMPATFMYAMAFSRGRIGLAAASATIMMVTVIAIVVPYLYSELRNKGND
ncbi:MAG: sugar ABC transporter permease [Arenicellales bacterium]|jgi:glucose/mannose transport system permease protein|nr:sugar ABC transporter permease [Arenicellales bacterium]HCV19876.1 ABC transporter permease [Gammaproteobacteria bacterium]MDP6314332.1 sugar ABC transporter permease [Arenicellales bacterium]MDP7192344.1 sugar ABC transporter permease [Arenicellales bacterium]MDP7490838.1 sugar ABC transporter permease [Arenicellales bacterium]|tara:strand:- start:1955 stop:2830 length:876 start_codon:yes stop_codon:yes gene_type:complete